MKAQAGMARNGNAKNGKDYLIWRQSLIKLEWSN